MPVLVGVSGYSQTAAVQKTIDTMTQNNMNVYRMSFSPPWANYKPFNAASIQYFLDHSPSHWICVVDRNHLYPPNATTAGQFRANLATARKNILDVCARWPNNPRVWVELCNEYTGSDFHSLFQGLISDVRSAGYKNTLVINKWNTNWSSCVFSDPQNAVVVGYHFYFNYWSYDSAVSSMKQALALGLKLLNTEIGADSREASYYNTSTVSAVTRFMAYCAPNKIGNCLWMNNNVDNWPKYVSLGLKLPPVAVVPAGPSYPLDFDSYPQGIKFSINNVSGYVTPFSKKLPAGQYRVIFPKSQTVNGVTWTFGHWGNNSTNPDRTINLDQNYYLYFASYNKSTSGLVVPRLVQGSDLSIGSI